MLGLFSKKNTHPLADPQEAKRIVDQLPGLKPDAAIDEASAWLEALSGLDEFPPALRYQRVVEIDIAAIAQARRLAREYYTTRHPSRFEEQKRWQRNQSYWAHLAIAYARCLADCDADPKAGEVLRGELGLLLTRLLNALAGRLRWTRLRYGSIEGDHWQEFGAVYLRALREGLADKAVLPYGPAGGASSPTTEYLKMLLLQASSIDNLTLVEVGIAERLLAHFLGHFVFGPHPTPETTYWIDMAAASSPARLMKAPPPSASLRFFGAGRVLEEIEKLQALTRKNHLFPPEIDLGGQYPPERVLPVLAHLAQCWAPKPPTRKHARHRIAGHVEILNGMNAVHCQLKGSCPFDETVTWKVDDISQGGMSAKLPLLANDWVRVGAFVAMHPEGSPGWMVGAVRRFIRESEVQGSVGIETLAKAPRAVEAQEGSFETDLILLDPLQQNGSVRVVMLPQSWDPSLPLRLAVEGRRWQLLPQERLETHEDWLLGRCIAEPMP